MPAGERQALRDWLARYLKAEALAGAGDPGPVVLRRLSNAQYTYTLRDLTGVPLDPAREFPVDGAAGEGFTNTGNALVMSPALLAKYFDAAKGVAAHAVPLPDGLRFSPGTTRRDWTDEAVERIRGFYCRVHRLRRRHAGQPPGDRLRHQRRRPPAAGTLPRGDPRRARRPDEAGRRPSRPWPASGS